MTAIPVISYIGSARFNLWRAGMRAITPSDAIDLITSTGLPVEVKRFDSVTVAERNARLYVRQTPPSPGSIRTDDRRAGLRMYVVPRLTEGLRRLASEDNRIAVAAVHDGVFMFEGKEYRAPSEATDFSSETVTRRVPWGRYALLRVLARTPDPRTQSHLATEAGVTQAAVSQSLRHLGDLVTRNSAGWQARDVRALSEAFLTQYPGPRGITSSWYSLEPVVAQADRIAATDGDAAVLISGDAGADLIAPWRKPTRAIVYGRTGLDLAASGFAESDPERATLEYTVPADPTIWATAAAFASGATPRNVDPLICAHDVRRIGGPDADDAVEHLLESIERNWTAA
ncbi:ArsR family transcriptional regulator [Agromyces sp. ZXT2-3]|uniref:ArsR family transcriptional regulator n=1 Tax=Agromyces sp. ZXT2-3 TaxID=3461152 RepID=UPI0040552A01